MDHHSETTQNSNVNEPQIATFEQPWRPKKLSVSPMAFPCYQQAIDADQERLKEILFLRCCRSGQCSSCPLSEEISTYTHLVQLVGEA